MPDDPQQPAPRGFSDDKAFVDRATRREMNSGQRFIALAILAVAGAIMAHVSGAQAPGSLVFTLAALVFAVEYLASFWARG